MSWLLWAQAEFSCACILIVYSIRDTLGYTTLLICESCNVYLQA
jgi:hypothetical protein